MPNFLKNLFTAPAITNDANPQEPNAKKPKPFLLIVALRAFMFIIFIVASLIIISNWLDDDYYDDDYKTATGDKCNVLGVSIVGDIVTFKSSEDAWETSSDDILIDLYYESEDQDTKAILIEIDSTGGYPVAAEEIAEAIKRTNKPTVAVIRESGNSAAYWVASAADIIFASKSSDLGSIGVSGSYLDYSEQNTREGIKYIDLSSGKFKNVGDPDRPLSEEERELLLRDTKILHENFIAAVAENRQMDIEAVRQLADGSTMLGQMALEKGLIDRIGLFHDAVDYLEDLLGEEVDLCWY